MKKTILNVLIVVLAVLMLSSCVTGTKSEKLAVEGQKPVLLVVSFGTSYNNSRELTIGSIEKALDEAYGKDFEVRRAFTSQIIIDKLANRDGLQIDNVDQAMNRIIADGVKTLVVQPTHVMGGFEYDDMVAEVSKYADSFDKLVIGRPLLDTDDNYRKAVKIVADETAQYDGDNTAIIFMGHGTEHPANVTYAKLQEFFKEGTYSNYFVGTVEATPSLDDMIAVATENKFEKIVLLPFMIVAGDHANNDMAGDEEDSWKTAFKKQGFDVECVLKGLGQYKGIQNMFVEKAGEAINQL